MSADAASNPANFRWQSLFQRTDDPLFILNHRQRLLFVNRAWETLTGLPASEARGLICRRLDPVSTNQSLLETLAHVLCPPNQTKMGVSACMRRFLPGQPPARRWWDVEFVPLFAAGKRLALLGRIRVVASPESDSVLPFPEALTDIRRRAVQHYDLGQWPCELPALRRLGDQALLAATTNVPVLLIGEAGVGKEHLARCIHRLGTRAEGAFVSLDCARLPAAAIEFFLFPSAEKKSAGLGMIYLKEPALLPRDLQLRLVQLLESGGQEVRILAGTTTDLGSEVQSGRLLETLRHALATLQLEIPPLRERLADLPLLVSRLIERCNSRGGKQVTGLAPETWELFRAHIWPGNLNELHEALESARRHAKGELIHPIDLPAALRLRLRLDAIPQRIVDRPLNLDEILEGAERRLIQLALRRHPGNKTKAAESLGITRSRIARRMEMLGLSEGNRLIDTTDAADVLEPE